jgi:citrate lyase gamma subunit
MLTFKIDVPKDFGDQIRKAFENQIADAIRRGGVHGVRVSLDKRGALTLSGDADAVKKAEAVVRKMR